MRYLFILSLLFFAGCETAVQQAQSQTQQLKAERKPFLKSSVVMMTPTNYLMRENKRGEYDPKPKVVLIDEKAGKYELQWIGYDGEKKIVSYQRSDAIEGLAEARVEKVDKKFVYRYLIRNYPISPTYLSEFIVQTFSSDIRDEYIRTGDENLHIGHMASYIPQFSEGVWRVFAPLGQTKPKIMPGKNVEFQLDSLAPPGVVNCKAGAGEITLKGVGEHMPSELEKAMPGFEEMATCSTIGPVERLAKMSKSERIKYLLQNMPKFLEAGWMSSGTALIYKSILEREDLAGALEQAKKDLAKEFITSEVFHIIEGLNQ